MSGRQSVISEKRYWNSKIFDEKVFTKIFKETSAPMDTAKETSRQIVNNVIAACDISIPRRSTWKRIFLSESGEIATAGAVIKG